VSFEPGGGPPIQAQSMQEEFGQPVIIENKPGAAGNHWHELVVRAEKDGSTFGIMTAGRSSPPS
jgi:tripartite-type tricarboxylate transporter receptor subunit TctC